jgi:hypothetical protein
MIMTLNKLALDDSKKNVLDFFKEHTMAYFNSIVVNKQTSSLDKYK